MASNMTLSRYAVGTLLWNNYTHNAYNLCDTIDHPVQKLIIAHLNKFTAAENINKLCFVSYSQQIP